MNGENRNINGQIIDGCINGDPKAHFLLYKLYSKAMYNIAIRFLNNKMDAEDILQESFISAFEKLSTLSDHSSFGSWLKRIVINNCITHLRKHRFEFNDLDNYTDVEDTDDMEDYLYADPALIHAAIKELPGGGRTILILHALEGYKHREIAEMLGVSESTSKSQYKRALSLLGKNLKKKIYVS